MLFKDIPVLILMHYSKIGVKSYGLTNQIFALITSIIVAYRKKENIIVDYFIGVMLNKQI
jgi:hypothetical protein